MQQEDSVGQMGHGYENTPSDMEIGLFHPALLSEQLQDRVW